MSGLDTDGVWSAKTDRRVTEPAEQKLQPEQKLRLAQPRPVQREKSAYSEVDRVNTRHLSSFICRTDGRTRPAPLNIK